MGTYVDENLGQGEAIRYTARISLWKYAFNFLIGGVLILATSTAVVRSMLTPSGTAGSENGMRWVVLIVLLLELLILVWPFVARRSTELVITDKRLIAKYGVISVQSIEIRFDKIESVRVTQGLSGRLLNFGDIVVTGTGSTFDPIRNIANALQFRAALNQAMDPASRSGTS